MRERNKAMSEQPLTFESVFALIRESGGEFDRRMAESHREWQERSAEIDRIQKETAQQMKETDRLAKEAHKKISKLGSRIGDIVEHMLGDRIIDKFQALGYAITQCGRRYKFGLPKSVDRGEVDLYLENGDIAILIEIKTTLQTADVRKHLERMEKFRRCADARGDKRRFIGAVAGIVIEGEAQEFALENGMYVIVQSGESFEIADVPEGFQVKEW